MQICMKLDTVSSRNLKSDIREHLEVSGLNYSEIDVIARVHPSQVSRICRGEFKTLSHSVVQVCKALGVEIGTIKIDELADDALAQRLKRSVLEVWDQTPADAKRLVRFLHDLAELRRTRRSNASH